MLAARRTSLALIVLVILSFSINPTQNAISAPTQQTGVSSTITLDMYNLNDDAQFVPGVSVLCSPQNNNTTLFGCTSDSNHPYPYASSRITISMDSDYLLDVVSVELNPEREYHPNAIRAQAAAARSYAFSKIRDGSTINNSTNNQAFIPFYFDRLGLESEDNLVNPFNVSQNPCTLSGLRSEQRIICQAVNLKKYITATGSTNAAFTEFFADRINSTVQSTGILQSVSEPISNGCDANNFGHGRGMSQEGASRWARGNVCSNRSAGNTPWSVQWTRYDQILTHYYTGVDVRNTASGLTKAIADNRWVPLQINWGTGTGNIPNFISGNSYAATIQVQNTSTTDWSCPSGVTYVLGYRWVRYELVNNRYQEIVQTSSNISTPNLCELAKGTDKQVSLTINDVPTTNPGVYDLRLDVSRRTNGVNSWFRSQSPTWPEYTQRVRVCPATGCPGRNPRAQDFVLVFDTTGSLSSALAEINAARTAIVNAIAAGGDNYRVAIVEFRDFANGGDFSFVSRLVLDFTSNQTSISNALNNLATYGGSGGDIPEAVYSGVTAGLNLSWRATAAKRLIVLGDAEAKNPEPTTNYTNETVVNLAKEVNGSPVVIDGVAVPDLSDQIGSEFDFRRLAYGTGGNFFSTTSQIDADDALIQAINAAKSAPLANAGGPYYLLPGDMTTFNGITSSDPDSLIVTYEWDLDGDGVFEEVTAQPILNAIYPSNPSGEIALRTTDAAGNSSIATAAVIPSNSNVIFTDGFEGGSLSRWTEQVTDGGNLRVNSASLLAGSRGLEALINDNNRLYVTDYSPTAEQRYYARWLFDPNSIAMTEGDSFAIMYGVDIDGPTPGGSVVALVNFERVGGQYQLQGQAIQDNGLMLIASRVPISDAPQLIELEWRAATGVGANNGSLTIWVNQEQRVSLTNIDNDTRRLERLNLGAIGGIDSGTRGSIFFDEVFAASYR